MSADMNAFRLPRYREIPDVGLYLEQVVKYINHALAPLGCMEITTSMVSNYVKQNYIEKPIKKQYTQNQIASLIFIAVIKNVLSMDNILTLFELQKKEYEAPEAYDYFCSEMETVLRAVFAGSCAAGNEDLAEEQRMLHSAMIAAANIIYLNDCFARLKAVDGN